MPSRDLVYRVSISTGDARRQAQDLKRVIEGELRNISTGTINVGGRSGGGVNSNATAGISAGIGSSIVGGVASYLSVNLLKSLEATARAFAEGNTEIKRTNVAFQELSGSAGEAEARLVAIQRGAAGAVSQLGAIQIANQAAALGLANTAEGFQRLTEAARVTVLLSPVINDIQSAISELGLAAANTSYRRLDQLGLSVTEVRDRMKELQSANGDLSESQAFLEASTASLIAKGRGLLDSQVSQASGVERFNVAINEFLDQEGAFSNAIENVYGSLADVINQVLTLTNLGSDKNVGDFLVARVEELQRTRDQLDKAANNSDGGGFNIFGIGVREGTTPEILTPKQEVESLLPLLERLSSAYQKANDDLINGVPGALNYRKSLRDIAVQQEQDLLTLDELASAINNATTEYERFQQIQADATSFDRANVARSTANYNARAAEDARQADILDQSDSINSALQKRALGAVSTAGIEQSIQQLQEAKALVDQGIEALIASGVTDGDELLLRIEQIKQEALATFDEMEQRAADFSFAGMDTAFANIFENISIPESDFIPVLQDYRDQAYELFNEIAAAGGVATEEQAAQLDYLSSAASAAADEQGYLAQITGELGSAFLEANPLVGELVGQLYQSEAAYRAGQISADNYAGRMYALGSQLIAYLSQAGAATSATYQLVNAFSALAGTGGEFGIGFNFAQAQGNYLQSREEQRQRDAQRKAAERAAKEAEAAAKRAAAEQERAAKKAASELEKGAKQARQELESALKKVPGLFGRSQVTEKDMRFSEAGVYQDNADEYLRRLEDEVKNGVDWADVSIEDAKQALRDLGVQVADDNKIAFEQFADAYESGLLFFDPENIKKFIDEEAVKRNLDLQEKARIGQENILAAFGAGIDGAVAAATTGIAAAGGSGNATTGYTIPIKAELIPMTAGASGQTMPTLAGVSPVIDIAAIQGQLSTLTIPPLTLTTDLDDTAGQTLIGELSTQIAGLAPTLQAQGKILGAIMGSGLAFGENTGATLIEDLGTQIAGQQALVEAQGKVVGAILSSGIRTSFAEQPFGTDVVTALGAQFGANSAAIQAHGTIIGNIISYGLRTAVGETAVGNDIAMGLGRSLGENSMIFQEHGKTIGMLMQAGLAASWTGEGDTGAAMMLLSALSAQFTATQNFFYGIGQIPAQTVKDGFINYFSTGSEGGGQLVTPMLTSLGTGIRAASEDLRQRGGTMARELVYGFTSSFNSDEFKSVVVAAGETMGAYLEIGILSRIRGGALVEAIGAQVLADITETIEQPTN